MLDRIKGLADESVRCYSGFFSKEENLKIIGFAAEAMISALETDGKILVFGNGGSAADSQHFAAELIVKFRRGRQAFPCIALTCNSSVLTAHSNDYSFDSVFSRQIEALGRKGDVALAISTSGESANVLVGAETARRNGMKVVALTGREGGRLKDLADVNVNVPVDDTAQVQQIHIALLHMFCDLIEQALAQDVKK